MYDERFNKTLLIIDSSLSGVTVTVCIVGIAWVICLKLYKKFVYRLAMYQVIAACFFGLTGLMQLVAKLERNGLHTVCQVVAYAAVWSFWAQLLLTISVTVHLFIFTVFLKNLKKLELLYVILPVVVALAIAGFPFIDKSYGDTGPWCWIKDDPNNSDKLHKNEVQQLAVWYVTASAVLVVTSILVVITGGVSIFRVFQFKSVNAQQQGTERDVLIKRNETTKKQALYLLLPLLAYPIIFCVLIIIPLAYRVCYIEPECKTCKKFFIASAVFHPMMGLAAGVTLIAHLCLKELVTKKRNSKYYRIRIAKGGQEDADNQQTMSESTSCRTDFLMRPTTTCTETDLISFADS